METNNLMNSNSLSMEFVHTLSTKWVQQFENTPEFPFLFSINHDSLLCFNNTPLCPISEVDLNYDCIDVEWFSFETLSDDAFYFLINWPFNSEIVSATVYKNDVILFEVFA